MTDKEDTPAKTTPSAEEIAAASKPSAAAAKPATASPAKKGGLSGTFTAAADFVGEAFWQTLKWSIFMPFWLPTVLGWKATKSVATSDKPIFKKSVLTAATATVMAGFALSFYAAAGGTLSYGAAFGIVKLNDIKVEALNWPATEGKWPTGKIVRFSEKGTWPCNSYEGEFRTGEAAEVKIFSVRRTQTDLIEEIKNLPSNHNISMSYMDSGIEQSSFGEVVRRPNGDFKEIIPTTLLGCIQHTDHSATSIVQENRAVPAPAPANP